MSIQFDEARVSYQGQKHKVAVVVFGAKRETLSLADTARCAVDLDAARRTVSVIGERLRENTKGAEHELQAQCRLLTKWKERKPRY